MTTWLLETRILNISQRPGAATRTMTDANDDPT